MNIIENINNTTVPEMDWATQKNISYTQLSAWMECPHRWKQMYIDKIKQYRKSYYQLNKEKIKARTKAYYDKHLRKKTSTPLKDITEQIKILSNMAMNLEH